MHRPITLLIAALLLSSPAWAASDKGLPLDQVVAAMRAAVASQPGQIKEVEVDEKDQRMTVKVEIVAPDGRKHDVRVDAQSRKIIR